MPDEGLLLLSMLMFVLLLGCGRNRNEKNR